MQLHGDNMTAVVHGEIIYIREDGITVHSDICPPDHNIDKIDDKIRKFYHDSLDEWLNNSKGTGIFYLRQEGFRDYGNED